jgi:uncharacterized membrane protein HdeD (DUF308 family)
MGDYRRSLRRAGIVLIVLGLLDLAQAAYAAVTRLEFEIPFGVLALISGIYIYLGSVRMARWTAFFTALGLGLLAGLGIALPLLVPIGLIWPFLRTYPFLTTHHLLVGLAAAALMVWTYRGLTAPVALPTSNGQARRQKRARVWSLYGLIPGVALAIGMVVGWNLFLRSEDVRRARLEAARKTGPGYGYFVYEWSWDNPPGTRLNGARVLAYNARGVREVQVTWEK